MNDLPKSLTEARNSGSVHYFTGKPCKRGHIAARRTVNQNCIECQKGYSLAFHYKNRDERLAVMSAYAKAHPEENAQRTKRSWKKKSPEERNRYMQPYRIARCARMKAHGGKVHPREWQALLAKYDGKCVCCGSTERIEMDHVIPLSKGGLHVIANIQPLCRTCNAKKSANDTDYRA